MQKTRIEVRTNFVARVDAYIAAQLKFKVEINNFSNVANINGKIKIDSPNIELVVFGIQTQTSLIDNIHKTCYKQTINNLTESRYNNIITSQTQILWHCGRKYYTVTVNHKNQCNMENGQFESNLSDYYGAIIRLLKLLIDKVKMSEEF